MEIPEELENDFSAAERELLRELLGGLRRIRYGSILLTLHEGKIVEIHKTERIRKGTARSAG